MSEREKTSPNSPRRGPMGGHGPMGGGPGGPMMPGAKAKDFKGSMKKLLRYMAQYKFRVLLVVLAAVVSTVLMIFGPKVLGQATTEMFNGIRARLPAPARGSISARLRRFCCGWSASMSPARPVPICRAG